MSVDNNSPEKLNNQDGILYLEGLIFMKAKLIKENDSLVQETFEDLYKYVSHN